jgi:hypothetical protein
VAGNTAIGDAEAARSHLDRNQVSVENRGQATQSPILTIRKSVIE